MLLQAMKLDSESPYHHHRPHEDDTKGNVRNENSFIFAKDNQFMINMFDVDEESLKERKHVLPLPIEGRKNSNTADPHKQYLNIEEFIDKDRSGGECMEAPYFSPVSSFEMVAKEDFFTDKIVTKAGLPETKFCIEDMPSCLVKDISIDEGVQPSCKNPVEEEGDTVESSISNQIIEDRHNDSTSNSIDSSGSDYLKYSLFDSPVTVVVKDQAYSASILQNDPSLNDSSMCPIKREGNIDTAESLVSDEVTEKSGVSASSHNNTAESLLSVNNDCDEKCASVSSVNGADKLGTDELAVANMSVEGPERQLFQVDTSSHIINNGQKQSVGGQKFQAVSQDRNSTLSALALSSEGSASANESVEIPDNCKLPSEVVTFSLDTEEVSTSGRDVNKEDTDRQQSEVVQTGRGTEEAMIDSASTSTRCSFRHLIQRESNLSGPDISSGPIINSGHIPSPGSISFRSESSTTSTRSFAFPILQSEWNSSPVKMAKAKPKKNRGCRMGLLCCRF